jgi:hypothetical protein
MTRIVAVGYQERGYVSGQPPVPSFPNGLARDDLRILADFVANEARAGQDVVVVHPVWRAEPSLRLLRTVRAALGTTRMATYGTGLPPLAGSVLCGLAARLAALLPSSGALLTGLPAVERQLLVVAQLDRIHRLRWPRPGLRERLASRWPTTSFAFSLWPTPHVRWLRPEDPTVALPPRDGWAGVPLRRLALSAHRGAELDWVEEIVVPALGTAHLVEVESSPLAGAFWGTTRVIEVVAYPIDLRALAAGILHGLESVTCAWCAATISSQRCPFCGVEQGGRLRWRALA